MTSLSDIVMLFSMHLERHASTFQTLDLQSLTARVAAKMTPGAGRNDST